jgi:hypothetical protein
MDELKEFFQSQKKWVTAFGAFAAGVILLIIYSQSDADMKKFALADAAIAKWEKIQDDSSYAEMRQLLHKSPMLEKKYLPRITKKLMEKNQTLEACSLTKETAEPVRDEIPFHLEYSETTLLIEKQAFQEALEKSVGLKAKMSKIGSFDQPDVGGSVLYAHNLIRIASLQKQLGNPFGEKAALEELEGFLLTNKPLSEMIYSNFKEQNLDLSHYILERKKQL